jgi:hypothetical protein
MTEKTQSDLSHVATKNSNIVELNGKILHLTDSSSSQFFGFYDICPWSPSGDRLIILSCPADFLRMPNGEPANVCVWYPSSGKVEKIGQTTGWNWQHGARQQWLSDDEVIFNDVDASGSQCSRIISLGSKSLRTLPMTTSAVHPNKTWGVSANYARLAKYYSTYGYANAVNSNIIDAPDRDGLWQLNLLTGISDLLLSYSSICDRLGIKFHPTMFVSHPDFSSSGRRLEFFLICDSGAGTSSMRLVVFEPQVDRLTLISEEKASHPAWIDDDQLWYWARESSAVRAISRSGILSIPGMGVAAKIARKFQGKIRNTILSEGFFVYSFSAPSKKSRIGKGLLNEDGHFSKHPRAAVMLGDTYPDSNGYLTLFVFSLITGRRVDVARVKHDVRSDQLSLRCDLHPRWSRDGRSVSFDLCIQGVRHVALIDISNALAKLESEYAA